jgi:uncharacterized protein YndB with AHSA1/START domain
MAIWLALLLLLAEPAAVAGFPGVADSSFTAASGERTMRLTTEIAAPPKAIWPLLSTAEGWKTWGVATAYIDFHDGGMIETSYTAGKPQGDRDNIKNAIIAIEPERMLVFRNVQAPRDFKDPELFAHVISTLRIEPLGPNRSRITYLGDGFDAGPGFDALYEKFLGGNAYTLVKLKEAAEKPAPRR